MSLVIKREGPSTEPCGTPLERGGKERWRRREFRKGGKREKEKALVRGE